jgi:sec-independent protein translocase protein TatA
MAMPLNPSEATRRKAMFDGLFQPIHVLLILTVLLIVFGPSKLPSFGGALGKTVKGFKNGLGHESQIKSPVPAPPLRLSSGRPAEPSEVAPGSDSNNV